MRALIIDLPLVQLHGTGAACQADAGDSSEAVAIHLQGSCSSGEAIVPAVCYSLDWSKTEGTRVSSAGFLVG